MGLRRGRDNRRMKSALSQLIASDGPIVVAVRARFAQTLAIYAFGSQVQGCTGPDSDLDLAVLVAGYADPLTLWDLSMGLANITGCPVDLLDLRRASTVMQYQVLTSGVRLWAEGVQAGLFECYVLSEKTALDEVRGPLLADIARTGTIYAR